MPGDQAKLGDKVQAQRTKACPQKERHGVLNERVIDPGQVGFVHERVMHCIGTSVQPCGLSRTRGQVHDQFAQSFNSRHQTGVLNGQSHAQVASGRRAKAFAGHHSD